MIYMQAWETVNEIIVKIIYNLGARKQQGTLKPNSESHRSYQ